MSWKPLITTRTEYCVLYRNDEDPCWYLEDTFSDKKSAIDHMNNLLNESCDNCRFRITKLESTTTERVIFQRRGKLK